MDSKMILHIYYWDKPKRSKEKVSFFITGFEDYKSIVKSLRYNRLKIVEITIERAFYEDKSHD